MRKSLHLAAASIIAMCAGSAFAAGGPDAEISAIPFKTPKSAKLLWNQNSNATGNYVNSQNYSSTFFAYDNQAADDFVIPNGRIWRITEVDVTGEYYNGAGPALSENVIFYRDREGMPGKPVRNGTFSNLNGTRGPSFELVLPGRGLRVKAGHYWVSVVANEDDDPAGQWAWEVNSAQHKDQAMWQNPSGGFSICPTWGTLESCTATGPDLMFDLRGTSRAY